MEKSRSKRKWLNKIIWYASLIRVEFSLVVKWTLMRCTIFIVTFHNALCAILKWLKCNFVSFKCISLLWYCVCHFDIPLPMVSNLNQQTLSSYALFLLCFSDSIYTQAYANTTIYSRCVYACNLQLKLTTILGRSVSVSTVYSLFIFCKQLQLLCLISIELSANTNLYLYAVSSFVFHKSFCSCC